MRQLTKEHIVTERVVVRLPEPKGPAKDAYRCGHPHGGIACNRLIACHQCPFAELLEVEPAEAA
jgi:hypothetical protein